MRTSAARMISHHEMLAHVKGRVPPLADEPGSVGGWEVGGYCARAPVAEATSAETAPVMMNNVRFMRLLPADGMV